jgi:hypothetical protein
MTKRFQKLVLTVSALAALALGGAVFAQAQTSSTTTKTPTVAADPGNLQVGDQTTPDTGTPTPETGAAAETTAASETATETTSESAPSDGPGGHADAPGANVDHQFQGNE